MANNSQIQQINRLILRLEEGGSVFRSTLGKVIGVSGLCEFNQAWKDEKLSRKYRPKEILEYSKRLKKGLHLYSRTENSYLKLGSYKTRKLAEKAESELANSVEYLRDVVSSKPNLRFYVDRDPFECDDLCPETVPRPIWSTSNYKKSSDYFNITKQTVALEILGRFKNRLENNLVFGDEITFAPLEKRDKKVTLNDFSDFKF